MAGRVVVIHAAPAAFGLARAGYRRRASSRAARATEACWHWVSTAALSLPTVGPIAALAAVAGMLATSSLVPPRAQHECGMVVACVDITPAMLIAGVLCLIGALPRLPLPATVTAWLLAGPVVGLTMRPLAGPDDFRGWGVVTAWLFILPVQYGLLRGAWALRRALDRLWD